MRNNSRIILILAFLSLALSSGWALKHINEWALSTIKALSVLLLQGILGFAINTQPNASQRLRMSCTDATAHTQLYTMQIIVIDALIMLKVYDVAAIMSKVNLAILLISLAVYYLNWSRIYSLINTLALLLTTTIMTYYVVLPLNECYWTGGLVLLLILNYFAPRFLAILYDIPQVEVRVIGMCNFAIFSLNAINEIVATVKLDDEVKKRLLQG